MPQDGEGFSVVELLSGYQLCGVLLPSCSILKSDDRSARQNRYGIPPEFPLASFWPGIVNHLLGPNWYALGIHRPRYSHCAFGFSSPNDSHTCWNPWSVFQDGSGGSPTYTPQKGATAPEMGHSKSGHRVPTCMPLVLTACDGACKSQACAPKGSALSLLRAGLYSHCSFGFTSPKDSHTCWTPWFVFQYGSRGSPTYTPQKGGTAPEKGRSQSGHRDGAIAGPARTPGGPRLRRDGSVHPGLRQPRNGSRQPTKGKIGSWEPARRGWGFAVRD